MSSPFIGEIRMFAGNFPPNGWSFCDGTIVPISQNDALFNLIGTTYGGDGQNTFQLPNLQSRVPMHVGPGFALGQSGGTESVTLTTSQIPAHSHTLLGTTSVATQQTPNNNTFGEATLFNPYININPVSPMAAQAVSPTGGSQPHDNMLPFLCINFIISLFGIFPTQS